MKLFIALALLAVLSGVRAGESYGSNPCKAKGMYSANTRDVTKFVQAAALVPYIEVGACAYLYLCGPNPAACEAFLNGNSLTSMVDSISTSSITKADSLPGPIQFLVDTCQIKELELNYLCVGSPYGIYTDPRVTRRSRALLDDDSNRGFPFFTRFAMSVGIKAKVNFDGYGWTYAKTTFSLCVDINRSGPYGLPGAGDLIETCGNLSFVDSPPPSP